MNMLMDVFFVAIGAALINNYILYYFVGLCPFVGVSRNVEVAAGMGFAVIFVMTISALISWLITVFILAPGAPFTRFIASFFLDPEAAGKIDLMILGYTAYILAIASTVQFVEMYLRKFFPPLYKSFGVFLPLITTNCAILFACLIIMSHVTGLDDPSQAWGLFTSLAYAFFGGAGFTIAIVIMAGIREELEECDVPEPLKGAAITLIVTGILAMTFMGFTGVDSGLHQALGGG
jgi:Na+-translocating ferredoxin:NAD+ oxidoreductase subunit A